ncbi:hypothetical protein FRACYDRAFT_248133 [Fragilariopsis cylindrus CCMP1102]|uniref:Pyridoxamine 5'-phosphate oxidase N-terminal domain-containing protein n=1 Tax=Fragilariopsis cylindrus CCMP1102 TaxID=635003 RepID=A0A1E7EWH2_9STRA|nr:hypothetical protein FRACYDRAFT_248133 [Fragilariopsis cylindrus CCMP1102]|eukprot:OEU09883.1 hypothetical protein FRACYDRAFT_248133 [Fragilariopsis cylindrus CCMP1102]
MMRNSNSNSNISNNDALSLVLGTTLVVGTISSLGWYCYYNCNSNSNSTNNNKATREEEDGDNGSHDIIDRRTTNRRRRSTISNIDDDSISNNDNTNNNRSSLIKPPFPQPLRDMLSKCRLAYLSTVDIQATSSHLSLMRFTYLHDIIDGEIVIMSTNKNTKKFDMLQQQKGVALLVHDFDVDTEDKKTNSNEGTSTSTSTRSTITLNGDCCILTGKEEEKYRKEHLKHNPEYPQFIVGDDIAVLCVHVTSARICDLNDNVIHWNI